MNDSKREVIVVIGSGRSGTSVLTRILVALGMGQSEKYIKSSEQNPEGTYEDEEIFNIQEELYKLCQGSSYAPTPSDFLKIKGVDVLIKKLRTIVDRNVKSSRKTWGFKDPKTASLLPLWSRVFNPLKIVPKYILAVRNPSAVVSSLNRQYNDDFELAELVWLVRTCDALYYSGGNCFIVHYESWFDNNARKLVRELAEFSGLSVLVQNASSDKLLSKNIKKSLNRSGYEQYDPKNPLVVKLYKCLRQCNGIDFDRDLLMKVVIECRQAIQSFSPWLDLNIRQLDASREVKQREIERYEDENEKLFEKLEKKSEELNTVKVNAQALESQNKTFLSEKEQQRNENDKLFEKLKMKSEELNTIKVNAQALESQNKTFLSEKEQQRNENDKLFEKLEKKSEELNTIKVNAQALESQSIAFQSEVESLEEQLGILKKSLEEVKLVNKQLQENSGDLRSDNEKLVVKVSRQLHRKDAIQVLLTNAKVECSFLENKLHERQRNLVNLQKVKQELHNRTQTLQNKNVNKEKEILALQRLRQESQNRIKTLQTKNANKEKRVVRKEKAIFALQNSSSMRIGRTFVQAVTQPGKKTIFFPFFFLMALLEAAFVSKYAE